MLQSISKIYRGWTIRNHIPISKVPGQIIAMERRTGSKGGSMYHPVFTFTDLAGIVHTQRSSFGSSHRSCDVGERVTVLYDSTTPENTKIYSFPSVWLFPVFITGFGLLLGGIACFSLFLWTRQQAFRNDDAA